jgi:hypothetical protein
MIWLQQDTVIEKDVYFNLGWQAVLCVIDASRHLKNLPCSLWLWGFGRIKFIHLGHHCMKPIVLVGISVSRILHFVQGWGCWIYMSYRAAQKIENSWSAWVTVVPILLYSVLLKAVKDETRRRFFIGWRICLFAIIMSDWMAAVRCDWGHSGMCPDMLREVLFKCVVWYWRNEWNSVTSWSDLIYCVFLWESGVLDICWHACVWINGDQLQACVWSVLRDIMGKWSLLNS